MSAREVRCCCDGHLIGYLPARGKCGEIVGFRLYPDIEMAPYTAVGPPCVEVLTFEIETIAVPNEQWRLAYKSRDYPYEKLKQIPEFKPVCQIG